MKNLTKLVVSLVKDIDGLSGCFDKPSDSRPFPYATLDGHSQLPFDTKGDNGFETTLPIHVWSQSDGKVETYDYQDKIRTLLHQKRFTDTDGNEFLFFFLDSQVVVDPDNKTFHGISRFQVLSSS